MRKSNPHICKINSLSSVELVHLFFGLLQHPGGREIILEQAGELRSKEKCGLSCSLRRFSPFSTNGKVSVNLEWINTGVKTTLSFLLRRASFFLRTYQYTVVIRSNARGAHLLLATSSFFFRETAEYVWSIFQEITNTRKQTWITYCKNDQPSNRHKILKRDHSCEETMHSYGHSSWETETKTSVFVMRLQVSNWRKISHGWSHSHVIY